VAGTLDGVLTRHSSVCVNFPAGGEAEAWQCRVDRLDRLPCSVKPTTRICRGKGGHGLWLTRSLKNELSRLAPHTRDYCGGRINCVCPGWTVVPRSAAKLTDAGTIRKVAATMALPQIGRPEDIANAVVYLSSDTLARHVTGQTLVVAGGWRGGCSGSRMRSTRLLPENPVGHLWFC